MDLTRAINGQLWLEKLPRIHTKDKMSCNHKVIKALVKAVCLETEIRGLGHCPSGSNMPVESEWHNVGTLHFTHCILSRASLIFWLGACSYNEY